MNSNNLTDDQANLLYSYVYLYQLELRGLEQDIKSRPEQYAHLTAPWHPLYELPVNILLNTFLVISGLYEPLVNCSKSDAPHNALFNFTESDLASRELPEESQEYQTILIQFAKAVEANIRCFGIHTCYLNDLYEDGINGDDDALFRAIYVDRMIVSTPTVTSRIALAESTGDQEFFMNLSKAIDQSYKRGSRKELDDARLMLNMILENLDTDFVKNEELFELIAEKLQLYPTDGKDPMESFTKFLRKQIKKLKEINK